MLPVSETCQLGIKCRLSNYPSHSLPVKKVLKFDKKYLLFLFPNLVSGKSFLRHCKQLLLQCPNIWRCGTTDYSETALWKFLQKEKINIK